VSAWQTARAPGRVNLIGDHTDYQDGLCLPMAIDRDVRVTFRPRADGVVRATSEGFDGPAQLALGAERAALAGPDESSLPAWARTVAAVLAVLAREGRRPIGFDATVSSTVPVGSGLSSSAAFEVAFALAAATVAGMALDGDDLALAARDAEHLATGMPCGVMDQMAAVHGRAGHALLLDCRTLDVTPIALPTACEVLVVHSGIARRLETSAYAHRRAACEAAAARLGLPTLRDASAEQVASDPIARHVVGENERVDAFARALPRGDLAECGALMLASHASLRDDFDVSTPELDLLVDLAVQEGAFGARLTGAGFGGCIVALTLAGEAQSTAQRICDSYRAATELLPSAFTAHPADGAQVLDARATASEYEH
jgi:galactokinase